MAFCSSEQKRKTIQDTRNLINQMLAMTPQSQPQPQPSSTSNVSSSSSSNVSSSSRRSSTASSIDSSSSFLSIYFNTSEDDLDEVDVYMNVQYIPNERINVFDWWMERKSMFPNLYKIAMKMHSIPASSMQSERTFSRSGMVVSNRRTNLDPHTVESLIMLNKNFDFKASFLISFWQFLYFSHFFTCTNNLQISFLHNFFRMTMRKKLKCSKRQRMNMNKLAIRKNLPNRDNRSFLALNLE